MMSCISQRCCILLAICSIVLTAVHSSAQDGSPWQRPESSKALLESLGLKMDEIKDREQKSDKYFELYLRVLLRLKQLPRGIVDEWAKTPPALKAIDTDPANYRGDLFQIRGDINHLERIPLPKELADRFDVGALYRIMVSLPGDNSMKSDGNPYGGSGGIDVWTTEIPKALLRLETPASGDHKQRPLSVAVQGLFLLVAATETSPEKGGGREPLTFVASHLAWLPSSESSELSVTPSMTRLANAGFDVGLLDAVREETSKRLTAEVTEPFLQMLAAQSRVKWAAVDAKPLQLGKLVSQPKEFVGEAIEIDAVARRVVEIAIENEGDRKRLGIDRYYEIDVVIPKPIRTIVKDKDGKEREVEQANFPMTICSTELPQGIEIGADVRERIRAKAFFFKLWAYESKFAQEQAIEAMQVSPLFITARVERAPAPEVSSRSLLLVVGGAVGFMGLIAVWGYLLLRGDDLDEKRRKAAKQQVIESATISEPTSDSVVHD